MRFARCDACGAKALMAASQCPKCGHYLGLRDDKGDAVPVARCRGCGCYYPRRQGGCRWCGAPAAAPTSPAVRWGALGSVLVAGMAWGAVRVAGGGSADPAAGSPALATAATVAPPVVSAPPVAQPPSDSAVRPAVSRPNPASAVSTPARAMPDERALRPAPATALVSNVGSTPRAAAPEIVAPADTVKPVQGDQGTARTWVNVRAGTGKDSEVLGIISPDTKVEFGRSRGGWVEVRTARLSGWADRRLFLVAR